MKKNENLVSLRGILLRFAEKGVILWPNKTDFDMAKGNSWKTRNWTAADFGHAPRKIMKRELKSEPQFKFDELYITPFMQKKRYDEDGQWQYVAVERNMKPTGLRIMDDYLGYLTAGHSDMQVFADRHGLKLDEVSAMVFILTGIKGVRFRQLYQMRIVDDLLQYTDMAFDEVARRSGLGSPNNMYLALRREYNMSATERRHFLRKEDDVGRFRL
ncbi:MAG: helix-turn-helix transcriptional regulator [Anaerolineaceae bacterium]|nr:helix-turn-helix transcriptional regulator [Anaerolineaceae bacterium]